MEGDVGCLDISAWGLKMEGGGHRGVRVKLASWFGLWTSRPDPCLSSSVRTFYFSCLLCECAEVK